MILSIAACDDNKPAAGTDDAATGTNAPIVATVDIKKAFDDMFTNAYGDFTTATLFDMTHFNGVLGKNYHLVFHAIEVDNVNDVTTADYFFGINRIGEDYCFELIYITAIEFLKSGDGYAYFVCPDGADWDYDDTIRTSREHLKRIYNGIAYNVIAPYSDIYNSLERHEYTKGTYCDKECIMYNAQLSGKDDDGQNYSYNGEFYIDEETGISMYSVINRTSGDTDYSTTITCDEFDLGSARLDYAPEKYVYM